MNYISAQAIIDRLTALKGSINPHYPGAYCYESDLEDYDKAEEKIAAINIVLDHLLEVIEEMQADKPLPPLLDGYSI